MTDLIHGPYGDDGTRRDTETIEGMRKAAVWLRSCPTTSRQQASTVHELIVWLLEQATRLEQELS